LSPCRILKWTPSRYRIRQCSRPRALSPDLKLLRERLVQTADRAGTGSHSHERLGHFPHLGGARPGHKHVGESFGHMGFIATVPLKRLGVELPFTIVFEPSPPRSDQRRSKDSRR
jgi:hypothetical protein